MPKPPSSITRVWAAEVPAFNCHRNHIAPAPVELSYRLQAHGRVIHVPDCLVPGINSSNPFTTLQWRFTEGQQVFLSVLTQNNVKSAAFRADVISVCTCAVNASRNISGVGRIYRKLANVHKKMNEWQKQNNTRSLKYCNSSTVHSVNVIPKKFPVSE